MGIETHSSAQGASKLKIRLIVPTESGIRDWVLGYYGRKLIEGLEGRHDIAFAEEPEEGAVNYYLPWWVVLMHEEAPGKTCLLFTHLNVNWAARLALAHKEADAIVALTEHGKSKLLGAGVEEDKIEVIYPGCDEFRPRLLIVIAGRPYANGRKREWLPWEIAWRAPQKLRDSLSFVFLRQEWRPLAAALAANGVSAGVLDVDFSRYERAFNSADCLLSTGFVEGGSHDMLLAKACGLPIVSPRYGIAHDFPEGVYYYETVNECIDALGRLLGAKARIASSVQGCTWEHFVAQHELLFQRIGGPEDAKER